MNVPTHLAFKSPPPHQGSVLGLIVSGDPRLGEILRLVLFCIAIEQSIKETRAEVAALRATQVKEKLFGFTVGNDIESSSGKSVLEICWETIERVQYLNRRIALHNYPEERIERSGKFHYFLSRVAGIADGDVAASKAMDPRYDRRVRDYAAEAACPNYLIESFRDEKEEEQEARSEVNWFQTMVKMEVGVWDGWEFKKKEIVRIVPLRENLDNGNRLPRQRNGVASRGEQALYVPFGPVERTVAESSRPLASIDWVNHELTKPACTPHAVSLEDYKGRHKNDESVTLPHLPNFCATCSMWVTNLHNHAQCAADNKYEVGSVVPACKPEVLRDERFYSWLLEREILSSGGKDATDPAVQKIDKILKEKYRYHVR